MDIWNLSKVRGEKLKLLYDQAQKEAVCEFQKLKNNPLFTAGVMLYWGEGDKVTRHRVRLTNTEPRMIRVFLDFLILCGVPKNRMKAQLLLYPDLLGQHLEKSWSEQIDLPVEGFMRATVIQGRHPSKRLGSGVCILLVSSAYLKVKMLEWIRLTVEELIDKPNYENIGPVS